MKAAEMNSKFIYPCLSKDAQKTIKLLSQITLPSNA